MKKLFLILLIVASFTPAKAETTSEGMFVCTTRFYTQAALKKIAEGKSISDLTDSMKCFELKPDIEYTPIEEPDENGIIKIQVNGRNLYYQPDLTINK